MLRKSTVATIFLGAVLTFSVMGSGQAGALSPAFVPFPDPFDRGLPDCMTSVEGVQVPCPTPGPVAAEPGVVDPVALPDGSLPELIPPPGLEPEVELPPVEEPAVEPPPEASGDPAPNPSAAASDPADTGADVGALALEPVADPSHLTDVDDTSLARTAVEVAGPQPAEVESAAQPQAPVRWPVSGVLMMLTVAGVNGLARAVLLGMSLGRRTVG